MRNEFYKDSNAIILVYDVTNKKSLDGLDMWLREANDNGIEIVPTFIIGNKVIFIIGIIKHYIFWKLKNKFFKRKIKMED